MVRLVDVEPADDPVRKEVVLRRRRDDADGGTLLDGRPALLLDAVDIHLDRATAGVGGRTDDDVDRVVCRREPRLVGYVSLSDRDVRRVVDRHKRSVDVPADELVVRLWRGLQGMLRVRLDTSGCRTRRGSLRGVLRRDRQERLVHERRGKRLVRVHRDLTGSTRVSVAPRRKGVVGIRRRRDRSDTATVNLISPGRTRTRFSRSGLERVGDGTTITCRQREVVICERTNRAVSKRTTRLSVLIDRVQV